MRLKRGGMTLEAIREYVQLTLKGGKAKTARKEIMIETKESLEARLMEMQESLGIINCRLDTYEQGYSPITMKIGRGDS